MYNKGEEESKLTKKLMGEDASTQCIPKLVAYNGSLQIAHWMADTKSNEHKTLGDLYDSMIELTDKFSEVYMGKFGVITFPDDCNVEDITKAPIAVGLDIVSEGQKEYKKEEDLMNILADMESALNKAKYLLKE
jgi:hypothetical protein